MVSGINNMLSVKTNINESEKPLIQKRMIEWINFCHIARENDEDIFELAPYLKEIK